MSITDLKEARMDLSPVQGPLAGENEAEEEDEGNVQLPGQAEDADCDQDEVDINTEEATGHITPKTHIIELNEPQTSSETDKGCCSDEVVPFVLDEDFDYDNVVLTPKFTIRELKVLPK